MRNVLAVIPARSGSKRIFKKNICLFLGKPLIARTIEQARRCSIIDRVIVDTDSEDIAAIARSAGAEVPFLRPRKLATDSAKIVDSILHLLRRMENKFDYKPTHIIILQPTSPLRKLSDIKKCWNLIKKTDATTVLTVYPVQPRLYHLNQRGELAIANKTVKKSTNSQSWPNAYSLNGGVYIVKTPALIREKSIITKKTRGIVCDVWRSIDIDIPEEYVICELLAEKERIIEKRVAGFKCRAQSPLPRNACLPLPRSARQTGPEETCFCGAGRQFATGHNSIYEAHRRYKR